MSRVLVMVRLLTSVLGILAGCRRLGLVVSLGRLVLLVGGLTGVLGGNLGRMYGRLYLVTPRVLWVLLRVFFRVRSIGYVGCHSSLLWTSRCFVGM